MNNDNNSRAIYKANNYGDRLRSSLKKELKKDNNTLKARINNKFQTLLNVDRSRKKSNSGRYKPTCSDCPNFYFRHTGRTLKTL